MIGWLVYMLDVFLDCCSSLGSVWTGKLSIAVELWIRAAHLQDCVLLYRAVQVKRCMLKWRDHWLPGPDLYLGIPAGRVFETSGSCCLLPTSDCGKRPVVAVVQA